MKRFVIVYTTEVPENIPPDAKLRVSDLSSHTKDLFVGHFEFKEGSLNEGSKKVIDGHFNCQFLSSEENLIKEMQRRKKVYSKKDFNCCHPVLVKGIMKNILVEIAIRKVLIEKYNFKGLFDGAVPFFSAYMYEKEF